MNAIGCKERREFGKGRQRAWNRAISVCHPDLRPCNTLWRSLEFVEDHFSPDCAPLATCASPTEFLRHLLVHRSAGGASVMRDCARLGRCLGSVAGTISATKGARIAIPGFRGARQFTCGISGPGGSSLTPGAGASGTQGQSGYSFPTCQPRPRSPRPTCYIWWFWFCASFRAFLCSLPRPSIPRPIPQAKDMCRSRQINLFLSRASWA
jgi:hypothetical protein